MSCRFPRREIQIRVFRILFFISLLSAARFAAAAGKERDPRKMLDLIQPPVVEYPTQKPAAPPVTEDVKSPVALPAPERPASKPRATKPPKLPSSVRKNVTGSRSAPVSVSTGSSTAKVPVAASAAAAPFFPPESKISINMFQPPTNTGPLKDSRVSSAAVPVSQTTVKSDAPVPQKPHPASPRVKQEVEKPRPAAPVRAPSASATALPVPPAPASVAVSPESATAAPAAVVPPAMPASPAASLSSSAVGVTAETDQEESPAQVEPPGEIPPDEAILQKAREFHAAGAFEKMLELLEENRELVSDSSEAAELRLEQYLKEPQPDYRLLRSTADIILKSDGNNADANYAMGLYLVNSKKPDLSKALKHLGIAKAAKKPSAGAASLYWRTFAKKYWFLLLLPLVVMAAVLDKRRKRRQAAAGDETTPGETAPLQQLSKGWKGRISSLMEMMKRFGAKFRRKPPDDSILRDRTEEDISDTRKADTEEKKQQ